jgi:uncharacterized protein YdhG (YjbR/CyaY superfamily)
MAMRRTLPDKNVEAYIRTFPKNVRDILQAIRRAIRAAAPGAEETISYRMPAFKFQGRIVAYFAAFTNHIGLYPPAPKEFKKEASRYLGPKGNLKFPINEPIPLGLVKRIVKYRVKEISQRGPRSRRLAPVSQGQIN